MTLYNLLLQTVYYIFCFKRKESLTQAKEQVRNVLFVVYSYSSTDFCSAIECLKRELVAKYTVIHDIVVLTDTAELQVIYNNIYK